MVYTIILSRRTGTASILSLLGSPVISSSPYRSDLKERKIRSCCFSIWNPPFGPIKPRVLALLRPSRDPHLLGSPNVHLPHCPFLVLLQIRHACYPCVARPSFWNAFSLRTVGSLLHQVSFFFFFPIRFLPKRGRPSLAALSNSPPTIPPNPAFLSLIAFLYASSL